MSTVSIVIPSLNDAHLLRGCLEAVAAQSRPPDEVIVVDNGSDDDTAAVALAAGAVLLREPQRGVLRATARGFDAAVGDIIGRLDADSRPAADWTERLVHRFAADADLSALTGTGTFYGCGRFWRFVGRRVYLGGYFWFMGLMMGHTPLFGSNFAIRRSSWQRIRERVHLDDPRAHDDLDISFALLPDMAVEFDERLRVAVSARPFSSFSGFRRRASWGFHVVAVNWAEVGWLRRVLLGARSARARRKAARAALRPVSPRSDL